MSFDSKELRRLIEATDFAVLDPDAEVTLSYYLLDHKRAILARLETSDALASVVQEHCDDAVPQWAPTLRRTLDAYKKAKGA